MVFKLLLLLPALAIAKIEIELSGTFEKDLHLSFTGEEIDVISDRERDTFKLNDRNVKTGVEAYFGGWPDDAYLRSPTPWGDLFKSYGWPEVRRTLVPKRGRILSMTSQPQIVMQQIFENNSSKPATFNVGISQSLQNTMSSSWSKSEDLTINSDIGFDFDIDFANIAGKTSMVFSSSYGSSSQKAQTVTVGSSSHVDVLLQPGQSVMAELHATRGSLKVEMEYEASVSGDVAVNYNTPYKGHHFWGLSVEAVMNKAGLSDHLTSKQVIDVGFFTSSNVVVYDRKSNDKMMDIAF
ncbi:spherulin-2A-like [Pieris napi]|uniref:spherulin-2A-like n=1 Tax=Pieris napi TaxID=78633 RepID=UPI001FB8A6A7|nr:spherulin-2A-like [Pieris napi]